LLPLAFAFCSVANINNYVFCSRGVDCFSLQLAIIQNHLNGRDSHVRQMRVYSSRGQATFDIESGDFFVMTVVVSC
jgi:hypothetical protein